MRREEDEGTIHKIDVASCLGCSGKRQCLSLTRYPGSIPTSHTVPAIMLYAGLGGLAEETHSLYVQATRAV